jgi:hypothetical protein
MSAPEKKPVLAPGYEIAIQIYVELVARNTQVNEGAVKMGASAANLASLSLKLAEAFVQAEEDATAAREPVKKAKLEDSDVAAWMK